MSTDCRCTAKNAPMKIQFKGATYVRVAQLQQLLQQYETDTGALLKAIKLVQDSLQNAHKSAMGKNMDQTLKLLGEVKTALPKFSEEANTRVNDLINLANTIAGHIGMGGQ